MPAMQSYAQFVKQNQEYRFADALCLDAFIETLAPKGVRSARAEKAFLKGFTGQIFFLGTTFDTDIGPVYTFFNWSYVAPEGRYLCPVENTVRPDIPVLAAVYEE
jgi:hypothetical protein